ncbi:MAG: hypothetical protein U0163_05545 [Gemmatimonadaceae bacterium]
MILGARRTGGGDLALGMGLVAGGRAQEDRRRPAATGNNRKDASTWRTSTMRRGLSWKCVNPWRFTASMASSSTLEAT